jgi:uncharacterized membrane protein
MLPSGLAETATRVLGQVPGRPDQPIMPRIVIEELSAPLDATDRTPIAFQNTALYSPLSYLPQAVGIRLIRLFFPASSLVLLYAARVGNLAASIFLCCWAIKITPIGKWAFFLLALAPMAVFQAASASGDALAMGLTLLAAAGFLRIIRQDRCIQTWELVCLIAIAAGLALVKPPYVIVAALFAVIPSSKFQSKGQRCWFIITLALVTIFLVVGWALIAHGLYRPLRLDINTNPAAQLNSMLQSPIHYLRVVLVTHSITASVQTFAQFVGVLGWLDTPIPLWAVGLYYSLFLLALSSPQPVLLPSRFQRLFALGLWLTAFGIIDMLLYLTWTQVGGMRIEGLQGRYYLPLAPLLVVVGYGLIKVEQDLIVRRCIFLVGILVILTTATYVLLSRYYAIGSV